MGDIGRQALEGLRAAAYDAVLVDFPQNVFRDEVGYRRELRKALRESGACVVIPVGNTLALSRMRDDLRTEGVRALVEREELVSVLDSKVRFSALASELGIPQPRIFAGASDADFSRVIVFKRDVSFGGHGVHLPRNAASLDNLIAHQRAGEPYLIEEYVEGDDWSVDVVGSPECGYVASSYRCLEGKGTSGPALRREVVENPLLEGYARKVLESLGYCGVCGFDFRVAADGRAYVLEANPRFTGGLGDQIVSGFNIPARLLELYRACTM